MTLPDINTLYRAIDATWPAAGFQRVGPWVVRDGQGGGKRVSAATMSEPVVSDDIDLAAQAMRDLNQKPLFMIRDGEQALDQMLAKRGYSVIDPVTAYAGPIAEMIDDQPPLDYVFSVWPPLAMMRNIWAEGGVDAPRISVMERATAPKTGLLGRIGDDPAGCAFVSITSNLAMIHAIEVVATQRRQGMGINMMRVAAKWAQDQGATAVSLLVTDVNAPANALYSKLGMSIIGRYHYRIL